MKKLKGFGINLSVLFALVLFALFISSASAVRINEIELNPKGTDSGNEWLELYSEQEVNLSGWSLVNKDNDELSLNETFQGYLIINFVGQWLDNGDEKVILKDNNGDIVDETTDLNDNYNDDRTWQYCDKWIFENATENSANSCGEGGNGGGNSNGNGEREQEAKVYIELEWDEDEIINGEEFEIESRIFNLKDKNYEIKIYITFKDNDTVISETYQEDDDRWKSSTYYTGDIVGPGNKSVDFSLRIKEEYENFKGDAKIRVKVRESGSSFIIREFEDDIEILEKNEKKEAEKEEVEEAKEEIVEKTMGYENKTRTIIQLGNKDKIQGQTEEAKEKTEETKEKIEKSKIIYESGSEKIKKYAIYALNIVLILIIIFLLTSFKKGRELNKKVK